MCVFAPAYHIILLVLKMLKSNCVDTETTELLIFTHDTVMTKSFDYIIFLVEAIFVLIKPG